MIRKIAFLLIIFFSYVFIAYIFSLLNINETEIQYCLKTKNQSEIDKCYKKLFNSLLLKKLLIYKYKVNSENKDKKDSYIVLDQWTKLSSYYAMKKADLLLSYGIAYDIAFEDNYSLLFRDKYTYAYDCGISEESFPKENNRYFFSECIGTDKYILDWEGQISSRKIHTFDEKLKQLKLKDKNIFLKIDVAGAEYDVLPEILKYSNQITGLTITFHIDNIEMLHNMSNMLDILNKDFILISRNTLNNYAHSINIDSILYKGNINCNTIVLSYINKNLVSNYNILLNQNTKKLYKNYYRYNGEELKEFHTIDKTFDNNNISIIIPVIEKIKLLFNK